MAGPQICAEKMLIPADGLGYKHRLVSGHPHPSASFRGDALARIRTGTTFATAPSRQRVYQFHHQGRPGQMPGKEQAIVALNAGQGCGRSLERDGGSRPTAEGSRVDQPALGRYRGGVLMSTRSRGWGAFVKAHSLAERAFFNARTDAQYEALFQQPPSPQASAHLDLEPRMRLPQGVLYKHRRLSTREDETQILGSFGWRQQLLAPVCGY